MPGGSKSERTKLRIQQAAARLFASRSFETVSTRAIAKEAGVDAALIHHYFGSKEGLFQAVLNAAIRPRTGDGSWCGPPTRSGPHPLPPL